MPGIVGPGQGSIGSLSDNKEYKTGVDASSIGASSLDAGAKEVDSTKEYISKSPFSKKR